MSRFLAHAIKAVSPDFISGVIMANRLLDTDIKVSLDSGPFVAGGPIPLEVIYENRSQDRIVFDEPARTWEVVLSAKENDKVAREVPLGRYQRINYDGISRTEREKARRIELSPGGRHQFVCDLSQRWPELFPPARHTVCIIDRTDDDRPVTSNTVELVVVFTPDSVEHFVGLLRDKRSTVEAREFATEWLAKLRPGFWIRAKGLDSVAIAENDKMIADLEMWWSANKHTHETADKLAMINSLTDPHRGGRR